MAAATLTIAAILPLAPGVRASDIMVSQAFARASATPAAKAGSAYLTLANHGSNADRLIRITAAAAQTAGLHETVTENGVMMMRAVDSVELPPGAVIEFKPGGLHVMLSGLTSPLKQGETLSLTLRFETAGEVKVTVPVAGVAAQSPDQTTGASGG